MTIPTHPVLDSFLDETFSTLARVRNQHRAALRRVEVGCVQRVGQGIAHVSGLPGVRAEELVMLAGNLPGMAFDLAGEEVGVVLLGDSQAIEAGSEVRRTGNVMDMPVGTELLGRVVDATGAPLDNLGPLRTIQRWPIERPAPPILHRAPVTEPLQTGLKAIDALVPIGRGQRELILGDRQTGKTAIAQAAVLNQHDSNVLCVYCLIGQRTAAAARLLDDLRRRGAMSYTTLVVASGEDALRAAARGILTTDKVDKLAGRSIDTEHGPVQITGIAKGSGMIGPNMATMLALIMTDAALDPDEAQALLAATNDDTFNCISVDGHTSTNDTALLLASGKAARLREGDRNWPAFAQGVHEVCEDLAKQIVRDGEGATHLVEIFASGCADKAAARTVARTIANSPLVKTAIAGADPNWGRIVSAAGYAGVEFDPQGTSLKVAGTLLYDRGQPVPFDAEEVSAAIRGSADTKIEISFSAGQASARFWTCDLTIEYIHINADYHT